MEDKIREKIVFSVEKEKQKKKKKQRAWHRAKKFSEVKNKNHEQERVKKEENNFKYMKELRKVIISSLKKNERRSKTEFF